MRNPLIVLAFLVSSCASVTYLPGGGGGLDEPVASDSVTKVGSSYECDIRTVKVQNPLDEAVTASVDCKCGDSVEVQVPAHTLAVVLVKSGKSLDHPNACEMTWAFKGQPQPKVIQRKQP